MTYTLQLTLGEESCILSITELGKFPDSLLGNIASSTAAAAEPDASRTAVAEAAPGGSRASKLQLSTSKGSSTLQFVSKAQHGNRASSSSSGSTVTINLDDIPNNPFKGLPKALTLIPALYRHGCIPVAILEQMLASCTIAAEQTVGQQAVSSYVSLGGGSSSSSNCKRRSCAECYRRLTDMLEFLGLPGPVTKWLRLADYSLGNSNALQFSYHCVVMQAVDTIMRFRPHLVAQDGWDSLRLAAFAVAITSAASALGNKSGEGTHVPGLSVAAVDLRKECKQLVLRELAAQRNNSLLPTDSVSLTAGASHPVPPLYKLPLCDGVKPAQLDAKTAWCLLHKAEGAAHLGFGKLLLEELRAATTGTSLEIVPADVRMYYQRDECNVQLWVVRW